MSKILVTGSNGQLGSELKDISYKFKEFEFLFVDIQDFSLTDFEQTASFLDNHKPDYVVNCAAYTAVDKAETEMVIANEVNHIAVGFISEWCFENQARLIHISTDYVFDGTKQTPLTELNSTNPINVYGVTKRAGELKCLENCPESIIIRTSWVYSYYGNNFVKTMVRLLNERDKINVVNDQFGSPTYALDLAEVIMKIIISKVWTPGIFNYSNEGEISWYGFAEEIKGLIGSKCIIKGIPANEYPTPAKRPAYSLLDKSKIKSIYQIDIPYYRDSLINCLNRLKK